MPAALLFALTASRALASSSTGSPSAGLQLWRASRLRSWSHALNQRFDREYHAFGMARTDLRYRTQILVVDDDGVSARICEAVLDRLCEALDADVDALAASVNPASRPSTELCHACAALGLSAVPLEAGTVELSASALLTASRWDLVLCTNLDVLERVRSLARAVNAIDSTGGALPSSADREEAVLRWSAHPSGEGGDASVLCITDCVSSALPGRKQGLPSALLQIVDRFESAQQVDGAGPGALALVELPRSPHRDEIGAEQHRALEDLAAAAALSCCGFASFLEQAMRDHAQRAFRRDLTSAMGAAAADGTRTAPGWEEVQSSLQQEHAVPGGLSDKERRRVFEAHVAELRSCKAEGEV